MHVHASFANYNVLIIDANVVSSCFVRKRKITLNHSSILKQVVAGYNGTGVAPLVPKSVF